MSITSRRLAPLLIATTIATGGLALSNTANAAPVPTTASVTTDSNNPLLEAFRKSGNLTKIDNNNTANGGDTQPPNGGTQPQPPSNDETKPPTGGAGGTDHQPGDGILGGIGGSAGTEHKNDGDPNADGLNIVIYDDSPLGGHYPSESRTDDARPGPVITDD
ncbi:MULTISPECIES: hypothetical protein [unclassified Streptomyces]|uniref:hypothetical protein n=1 Tax=unclassified Streptomyces TaxID=2593676 RepID=UPI0028874C89|nr:hypothetical protein [Streptomyces sp. DSM 41633]